jgi:hypothetical protein
LSKKTKIHPITKNTQVEIDNLKRKYLKGMRVRLICMKYEEPVVSGTFGTIYGIDNLGQIIMEWECGSELALVPDLDEFELV